MARDESPFRILLPKGLLLLGACAGGPGASDAGEAAPRGETAGAVAVRGDDSGRAAQVLQIHDVRDLVDPPGDAGRVAELASEIGAMVTFLFPDVDPDAWVGAKGTAVVVRAVPEIQFRVRRHLEERRRGVASPGI